ncbi:Alpha/Beta hydrolase protein [Xylariaceae sp. FL0255]|nr:Alpha/Beta hydrolase protein [Xylariaceae sp. FL0255]
MALSELIDHVKLMALVYIIRASAYVSNLFNYRLENHLYSDITHRKIQIPSRDPNRSIAAWIWYPKDYDTTKKTPVLLNWHGSGYVIPNLGTDSVFCARLARDAGILVIDADYRKGPENSAPAALYDAEDALTWVASRPEGFNFDLERVAVSGFSAGGSLALVLASIRRAHFESLHIPIVVTIYPATDLTSGVADVELSPEEAKANPLPPFMHDLFRRCYVPDPSPSARKDPLVSPAYADPTSFPDNVVILTSGWDPLALEANDLAAKLDDGKRKVVHRVLDNVPHIFDKGCKEDSNAWRQRDIAYGVAVEAVKDAFGL